MKLWTLILASALAFTSLLGTKPPGSDRAVHLVGTSITSATLISFQFNERFRGV